VVDSKHLPTSYHSTTGLSELALGGRRHKTYHSSLVASTTHQLIHFTLLTMAAPASQEDQTTAVPAATAPTTISEPTVPTSLLAAAVGSDPAEDAPDDHPTPATAAAYGEIPHEPLPEDGLVEIVSPCTD
jgi:hypothetical protein